MGLPLIRVSKITRHSKHCIWRPPVKNKHEDDIAFLLIGLVITMVILASIIMSLK